MGAFVELLFDTWLILLHRQPVCNSLIIPAARGLPPLSEKGEKENRLLPAAPEMNRAAVVYPVDVPACRCIVGNEKPEKIWPQRAG